MKNKCNFYKGKSIFEWKAEYLQHEKLLLKDICIPLLKRKLEGQPTADCDALRYFECIRLNLSHFPTL
jgi:hypothetical protein